MTELELLSAVRNYIETYVFDNLKKKALAQHSKISNYKINPIISRFLSKILVDNYNPEGLSRALFYPRILGTSINTSFGTQIQNMFVHLGLATGSLIKGVDIEFVDKVSNRKTWCQIKSGPNTINSDDVNPILRKFDSILNLARTNAALSQLSNRDCIIGLLYGSEDQLSKHYQKINERFPVIIGKEFWHRITGFENFYDQLVIEIDDLVTNYNSEDFLNEGLRKLQRDIEESGFLS